jgi:hypothetical protein
MTSKEPSDDLYTFTIKSSAKNKILAKLIITAGLIAITTHLSLQSAICQYEEGKNLTQEEYLKDFNDHKRELLKSEFRANPVVTCLSSLIMLSLLIGSYELLSLMLAIILGKMIKSTSRK